MWNARMLSQECQAIAKKNILFVMGVSNLWSGMWNGTVEWKIEWNSECS